MYVAAKRVMPAQAPVADNVVPLTRPRNATNLSGVDDAALLTGVAKGEAKAFGELVQRHLSAVLATARRIVRDEAEAEDIAQEAFLKLWNNAAVLQSGDYGLRPWLSRVASNLAIDWLRRSKRFDVTDELPEQADPPLQLRQLETAEVTGRVETALASLPARQRVAVSLFHFDELSQRDVAALMELSEDALESLLARGRRRLRELLKDDWQELLITSGEDL
jgi:RNA polymerase sigma-70 factor (ECF subfamily)